MYFFVKPPPVLLPGPTALTPNYLLGLQPLERFNFRLVFVELADSYGTDPCPALPQVFSPPQTLGGFPIADLFFPLILRFSERTPSCL